MTRKQRQEAKTFAKDLAGFAVFALLILNAPTSSLQWLRPTTYSQEESKMANYIEKLGDMFKTFDLQQSAHVEPVNDGRGC